MPGHAILTIFAGWILVEREYLKKNLCSDLTHSKNFLPFAKSLNLPEFGVSVFWDVLPFLKVQGMSFQPGNVNNFTYLPLFLLPKLYLDEKTERVFELREILDTLARVMQGRLNLL